MSFMVISVGCSDNFLDVNENPNDPPISTPSLTLPVAQQGLAQLNATDMTYVGQFLAVNWATPSNWSANADFVRYNINSSFVHSVTIFETSYVSILKNLTYIENYEDVNGAIDYSAYKVITNILKGFQYQYLVDLYGDVPYSEANLREENYTPKYDDAETIYKDLIDKLTDAATLALNLPEVYEDPGSQDIIFNGNMTNWAQFANTIKLRMLVRLSNTGQDSYIQNQITLINSNGAGYITENVVVNPGYTNTLEKQNPYYGYIGNSPDDEELDRHDFTVASEYTLDYLINTNDDRVERLYAEAEDGGYHGVEQSTVLPGTGFTSDELSKVGPGLLVDSEQDQPIMLLSESLLLQAEAAERGYISGADAEALYNEAIEESFIHLGVEDAVIAAQAYYAQPINNVAWGSSANKIAAIITQKYVALNGSSIEAWIELTRTGFPIGVPVPAESDGVRPVRLLYPASEIARNSNNVPSQTALDAFTKNPFWK